MVWNFQYLFSIFIFNKTCTYTTFKSVVKTTELRLPKPRGKHYI